MSWIPFHYVDSEEFWFQSFAGTIRDRSIPNQLYSPGNLWGMMSVTHHMDERRHCVRGYWSLCTPCFFPMTSTGRSFQAFYGLRRGIRYLLLTHGGWYSAERFPLEATIWWTDQSGASATWRIGGFYLWILKDQTYTPWNPFRNKNWFFRVNLRGCSDPRHCLWHWMVCKKWLKILTFCGGGGSRSSLGISK